MDQHPYLRAYVAGIAVPTAFFLIASSAYTLFRLVYHPPVPVERFIVFPLAVVPNAWGLWNVVFVLWRQRLQMSIGLHGALLPFLIVPLGIVFVSLPNVTIPRFAVHFFPVAAPIGLILYYLAWKYLVGFLNRVVGLA